MRSTEVSDLRWPYLTLTLIWRNVKGHIQSYIDTNLINYPHSSQSHHAKLRLLTISLKSCEGCSSYDVITSWPDLTWPNFFHQKLRKGCPISYGEFQQDPPKRCGVQHRKTHGGGGCINPPLTGRGLKAGASPTGGGGEVLTPALLKTGSVDPPDSRIKWPKSGVFPIFRAFWGRLATLWRFDPHSKIRGDAPV